MRRIYVAGAYSGPNVMTVLGNMRRGMQLSYDALAHGFAPFCPWFDYHFKLMDHNNDLSLEDFYAYTMEWLRVSEAVLVVPGSNHSRGTQAELAEAVRLGVPIFHDLDSLIAWSASHE